MKKKVNNKLKNIDFDIPIPIPTSSQQKKENTFFSKEQLYAEKIRETIDKDIPDYVKGNVLYLRKNSLINLIIFSLIEVLILIILFSVIFFLPNNPINILIKVITVILSVIVFTILFFIIIIRLFVFNDIEKIKQKIILIRGNYINAVFFSNQRRIKFRAVIPLIDGKQFILDKLPYNIDMNCVFMDENQIPTIFYMIGIPNPLKFDLVSSLMEYFDNLEDGEEGIKRNNELKLDVRYSGETMRLVKNDIMMGALHKDRTAEFNKMTIWFLIIIGILIFVILIIVIILGTKNPTVTIVQNTTSPLIRSG